MDKKPIVIAKKWRIVEAGRNLATKVSTFVLLIEEFSGHPLLGDQAKCNYRSSRIIATDNKTYAETLNTFYKLIPQSRAMVAYLPPQEGDL